ncbi:MAG: protein kinase [Gemmatirosa sp.]|nr:protein kinase [Gemmatirosa sp.]
MARDLLHHLVPALAEDYRIERELGAGATARVYLAHDLKHDRMVALKVLRPELALAVGAERFLREIQTAARLSHPGILPLYDSGEADGLLYFTMPFVDGESLRDRLERDKRLPIADAVEIARDVAEALSHAHACGVIHRDIKPENILLAAGRPLVADFGIALALEESESERLTHTGMVVGTPPYMSPEQSAGLPLDQRSDVYSLACVLYEMLTGQPPFVGATLQSIAARRRVEPAPPVSTLRHDVPAALEAALAEALAKDPDDRFATTGAFAAALADPRRRRRRFTRQQMRRARIWLGVGAGIGVLSIAGAMILDRPRRAPLRERDWVLVSDFDGPAADPSMAAAVQELVTTELNQSRYLSTMPRAQLGSTLRAAGYADTTRVNVDLARQLAFRSSVRAVITGSVVAAPAGYALSVRAVNAENGRPIASAETTTPADSMIPAVQRLGRSLREQLGERRSDLEANQLLLDIATPSMDAYRKYVEGLARQRTGDVAGSTRLLHEAVSLDTAFAAAWALMGLDFVQLRDLDSARVAYRQALRWPARLSKAQRYRLLADAAYAVDRNVNEAIRWYDAYLALTPGSIGGHNNRGLYLLMLGRYEEALGEFESAEANNPFGPDQGQAAIINITETLVALGRLDRARAKAAELTGLYGPYAAMRLPSVSDQWGQADSAAMHTLAAPGTSAALRLEATTMHAAALAARGAVGEADRTLAAAAAASADVQRRWYEQARTLLALTSGRAVPELGPSLQRDTTPGGLLLRGTRLAARGDTVGARAIVARLAALPARDRSLLGRGVPIVDALVDANGGAWQRVVDALGPIARAGEHDATNLDHVSSLMMRWVVADAYSHLGQLDSAVAMMGRALSYERVPPGHVALRGFAYPFGQRRLATWLSARGDAAASRRAWSSFTTVFSTPDPALRALLTAPRPQPLTTPAAR